MGSDKIGYYDGSNWKNYFDNSGKLYLGGTSGRHIELYEDATSTALRFYGDNSQYALVSIHSYDSGLSSYSALYVRDEEHGISPKQATLTPYTLEFDQYSIIKTNADDLVLQPTGNLLIDSTVGPIGDGDLLSLGSNLLSVNGGVNLTGNLQVNGGEIGISSDVDLLNLTNNLLNVNGGVNLTGNLQVNGNYIGIDIDTDLLRLTSGLLKINGNLQVEEGYIGLSTDNDLLKIENDLITINGQLKVIRAGGNIRIDRGTEWWNMGVGGPYAKDVIFAYKGAEQFAIGDDGRVTVQGYVNSMDKFYCNNTPGVSGWIDDGSNFRVTFVGGIVTVIGDSVSGGHS